MALAKPVWAKPCRPARLAGVLLAATALAGCGRSADAPQGSGGGTGQVVARVDGRPILAADVRAEAIAQGLAAPNEPFDPASPVAARLLNEVIDRRLLAAEAVRRGLDKDAEGQRRLEAPRERALGDLLVSRTVAQAVDEAKVRAAYEAQLRLSTGQSPQSLDQARPGIVRFLTYDQIRDLIETLRAKARIEKPQNSAQGAKP